MSNSGKNSSVDPDLWLTLAGAAIVLFIFLFVGSILAVIVAIGGGLFAVYKIYHLYHHNPAREEERQRQLTLQLYNDTLATKHRTITRGKFAKIVGGHIRGLLPASVGITAIKIAEQIYDNEGFAAEIPPPPAIADSIHAARYRDQLAKYAAFGDAELRLAADTIGRAFYNCLDDLPSIDEAESAITLPLSTYFPDLADSMEYLIFPFFLDEAKHLFPRTRAALDLNYNAQKGLIPTKYRGDAVVRDYLQHTPFEKLFAIPVALDIPVEVKYEHAIITAGTGHGKTTLLENLLLADIENYERPSIVVIDSQQKLIAKLSRLAAVHRRELVIIDPKDAPALNVFDLNTTRIGTYDATAREQVLNHSLETFGYLFDALLGADLTVKQGTLFNYIIMLMLAMPAGMGRTATLHDLIELMEHPEQYAGAMDVLEPMAKQFFGTDFMQKQYGQTKEQIRYRLHAILGNPTLARLFLAPRNTIDFFDELASGSIILIDTDKHHLGAKNSSYLGRIAITLILQAILERGATRGHHHPVHIYIDEAGEYFDRSIDTFLTEARKHNAGITLAHQYVGQMSAELRASVAANTGTKYAGGVSSQDARTLASDMRTTPEFLLGQPRLNFACHIRNVTPTAVRVPVTVGCLDKADQVSEPEYEAFRERNRVRLCVPPATQEDAADTPAEPEGAAPETPGAAVIIRPGGDPTKSSEW